MYRPIDMERTGMKIKMMLKIAGYDVKYIQEYLHLSCPQSVYRWFKGKALPSVEHLCALGDLLHVHMEDLLVLQGETVKCKHIDVNSDSQTRRLVAYVQLLRRVA